MAEIKRAGPSRKQVGLILDTAPLSSPNTKFWPWVRDDKCIGKRPSDVYAPRVEENSALAMVNLESDKVSSNVEVEMTDDTCRATMVAMPFYDPKKSIAKS